MAQAVDLIIVSFLLGIVTDADNDVLGSGDRAGILGGHFEFAIARGDDADYRLAILKSEMERFRGNDRSNGVPLERNVASELRLEQKGFLVRLDDGSAQPVAIFQCYLIG